MPESEDKPASAEDPPKENREKRGSGKNDDAPTASAERKPIRRLHIAANVATQITLGIALFGIVNYLNFRHHTRWDLSSNQKYTLSEDTAGYLGNLDQKVHITMAFLSNSKIYQNLRALLDEYRRLSGGKISIDVFDPARDRNRAAAVTDKYKRKPFEKSTVIVEFDGKQIDITEDEMLDANGRIFRGEDALTSALVAATEEGRKKVYLITGHGALRQVDKRTALQELRDLSETQFFQVETLDLTDVSEVPDDADAVVVINASLDFSQRDIDMLRRFRDSDRGSLLFLLNPAGDTPQLYDFIAEYGIAPQKDRVLDASSAGVKDFNVQGIFLPGSPITQSLGRSSTTFPGKTCSLIVKENDDELIKKGLGIIALVQANPRFWGETDFDAARPVLDPEDNAPPVFVAAAALQGVTEDLRLRLESSRMVVVGNGNLLDPDNLTRSNTAFILSSLNWILKRENLIGIPGKTQTAYQLEITPRQHQNMFTLSIFVLPGAAFCFALFMWSARRS